MATEWPEFRELAPMISRAEWPAAWSSIPAAFLTSLRNHPALTVLSIGCVA